MKIDEIIELKTCENTKRQYRAVVRVWESYSTIPIKDADLELVAGFIRYLRVEKKAKATICNRLNILAHIHAIQNGGKNPFRNALKIAVLNRLNLSVPTPAMIVVQVAELLKLASETENGTRDGAMFGLSFGCGLRASELLSLNVDSVNVTSNHLTLKDTKTHHSVQQQIPSWCIGLVVKLITQRSLEGACNEDPLFVSNRNTRMHYRTWLRLFSLLTCKIGLKLSTHSARATAITQLLNTGVDVGLARKFARHASLNSTLRYDRRATSHLIEAAEKIVFN